MIRIGTRESPRGRRGSVTGALLYLMTVAAGGAVGFLTSPASPPPQERSFVIHARQYAYTPNVIRVNRGDTVRLRFISDDVVHGFYLEGHDIDVAIVPMRSTVDLRRPSTGGPKEQVEEVVFHADHEGKFRYRCSQTCGFMHPFMLGELIVSPNRLLPTGLGLLGGMLLGGLMLVLRKGVPS